jgi:subtilisin family serine protease
VAAYLPDLESAISDVVQTGRGGKGCLIFCATGNDYRNQVPFPARLDQALAIGASNDQGKRCAYSNFGPGIDLVAPSSDDGRAGITTTDLSRRSRGFSLNTAYTDDFGGISSATPLAAGSAALVLSKNPALSWAQVRDILRNSADKIDLAGANYNAQGFSLEYGYGRVNAHKAVQQA